MLIAMSLRAAILATACLAGPALAGEADVLSATASRGANGWDFLVTVSHPDEGWEHYADQFRIVGPDGAVYGVRELAHPHVHEQPFTRRLSSVRIPPGAGSVTVEARDSVHGWGGATATVKLTD